MVFYEQCISMLRNYDPVARGHLGSWDLCLSKLGKRVPGNAKHLCQVVLKKKTSESLYVHVFLWFEPRTPWHRAILDPGTFI